MEERPHKSGSCKHLFKDVCNTTSFIYTEWFFCIWFFNSCNYYFCVWWGYSFYSLFVFGFILFVHCNFRLSYHALLVQGINVALYLIYLIFLISRVYSQKQLLTGKSWKYWFWSRLPVGRELIFLAIVIIFWCWKFFHINLWNLLEYL